MAIFLHPFTLRPRKDAAIKVVLQSPVDPTGTPTAWPSATTSSHMITYWATQQTRVGAHESARFSFSAFVVAGSLVALGQIGQGEMSALGRWGVALAVVLANLVAVRLTLSELRWVKIHQARASAVLAVVLPEVQSMEALANQQWYAREKSGDNSVRFTSSMALQVVHWLVSVVAVVMAIAVGSR